MNNEEINKYLTEAMGECWHEWIIVESFEQYMPNRWKCRCGTEAGRIYSYDPLPSNNDFFTNEGYGKLRDWYDGWDEKRRSEFLIYVVDTIDISNLMVSEYCLHAFHRDHLAKLIFEFLQVGE